MRFTVAASNGFLPNASRLAGTDTPEPQGGFTTCGAPGASVAVATYREGHYVYTRKQPGIPTMEDITMSRGVTHTDTELWRWMLVVIEGANGYRSDVSINHHHRQGAFKYETSKLLTGEISTIPDRAASESLKLSTAPTRRYHLYDALPINVKAAGDMDSNNNEISISTMGVTYEAFKILTTGDLKTDDGT